MKVADSVLNLDEIDGYVDAILKNPNAGKIVRGPVRQRILRKFPYGILYSVKGNSIRILAVMNLKQTYLLARPILIGSTTEAQWRQRNETQQMRIPTTTIPPGFSEARTRSTG